MLNLIKHEILKSKMQVVSVFALLGILEIAYIISCLANIEILYVLSMGLFIMMFIISPFLILSHSLYIYQLDVTQKAKTGYMIFMTPTSANKIIASKLLTSFIAGAVFLLAEFIFISINAKMPFVNNDLMSENMFLIITDFISLISVSDILAVVFLLILLLTSFLINMFCKEMAELTIFSEMKFKAIISNIIFWGILLLPMFLLPDSKAIMDNIIASSESSSIIELFLNVQLMPYIVITTIITVALYIITVKLSEKKLSL